VEGDVHDARRQAESWARRALGIDPRCGEAWAALGQLEMLSTRADLDRSTDYALKAANFAPRDAFVHAILATPMNSWSLGLAAARRALELDPFLVAPAATAATCLAVLGRPHDALVLLDRTFMVEPDWQSGLVEKGWVLTRLGRLEEAESTLRRCEHAASGTHILGGMWRDARFALAVAQRDTAMSRTLAREILAADLDSRADALLVGNSMTVVVPALAHIGRTDDAIRLLQKGVEVGFIPNLDGLVIDPDIQLLRGDPRFAGILKASRDGALLDVRILGQARMRGELPNYLEAPLNDLAKLLNENGATR
jgi:tetratricopeptide (TPR) repeat protein